MMVASAGAAGPPQIAASWVENVTATSARLRAEINPNGEATSFYFEYVGDAAFQESGFAKAVKAPTSPGSAGSGSSFTEVTQLLIAPLHPLAPETIYRYRPVATNPSSTVPGPEHVFVTEGIGKSFALPDNRAWEMVSPVDKGGGAVARPGELFGGGDLQAAAAGGAVTYGSATAFADPDAAPPGSQYISRRSPGGWSTESVSPPQDSGAYGDDPDGVPYRVFSPDLSRAILFGGLPCRGGLAGCPAPNPPLPGSGAPTGYMAYYLRVSGGGFTSLLEAADVSHSAVAPDAFEVELVAANSSLSHVVLSSCAALTTDANEVLAAPGECDPAETNLYVWNAGALTAINLPPGASETEPGARIAAPIGAVSEDGARVYWSDGGETYLREGSQTVPLDPSEEGGVAFQSATPDGSVAFFIKAGHLFRFEAATGFASDLTPLGGVVGMLGASADGTHVYFQDGDGLELWHAGTITPVAADTADEAATVASDYPPATATARVSADGERLAFLSRAALTDFDNIDANSKEADAEAYVFNAIAAGDEPALVCASCNPTGERPEGSASIPGAEVNGSTRAYRPRALSADGRRLFFETDDGISDKDTNGGADVYQWEAEGLGGCASRFGCVAPISNASGTGGTFVDASADGADAYFVTQDSLVGSDPGSIDLYDARIDGGIPEVAPEEICVGDSCQPLPGEPDDPTPGTLVPNSGNPPLRVLGPRKKAKRQRKHRRRHAGRHDKRVRGAQQGRRGQ